MDVGIGMPELGEIRLSDLASIVGPNKQPILRDRYFKAVRPLSEYLRLAQENGAIVDRAVPATARPGGLRLFGSGLRQIRSESAFLRQIDIAVTQTVTIFQAVCGMVVLAAKRL